MPDGKKTFVRGADGSLYLLTKNAPLVKLTDTEAEKLEGILENAKQRFQELLTKEIEETIEMACAHNIDVTVPDVSIE
jgi:hypothetical protein